MSNLNEKQLEAINANNNVVVVIAGAGSGKTTVLVEKVEKALMTEDCESGNILAITFTNKAAKEMKERLISKVGPYAMDSWIMTFHAFAVRIIRQNIKYLKNFKPNFLIIDEEDKKKILKKIIKNTENHENFKEIIASFNHAKKEALFPKDVVHIVDSNFEDVYLKYEKYLIDNNAMDFDDLLHYAYELLQTKEVRLKYQNKFKYILVDEFQDTSHLQGEILKLLKIETNKMFIVGDVDQSIYTWRGATVDNMLKIENHYQGVVFIKLEQNYRSTKKILEAANSLIEENSNRFDKSLWTANNSGEEIIWNQYPSANKEAEGTVKTIDSILEIGEDINEIAILYRYNYQSRKIEEQLIKNHIPYEIYGGLRFYERMEIKDLLSYLRVILNPDDNISFERIINVPKRKIGEKTILKYQANADHLQVSLFKAVEDIGNQVMQNIIKIIYKYQLLIKSDFEINFPLFLEEINYYQYLDNYDDKSTERKENITELINSITQILEEGTELAEYLSDLALLSANDENTTNESVKLSTIHGVKGLEFENVFLLGLSETIFPKERALLDAEELEEERRLCYVAVTRAKKQLYLSNYLYNFRGEYLDESRFIKELGVYNENVVWDDFIF